MCRIPGITYLEKKKKSFSPHKQHDQKEIARILFQALVKNNIKKNAPIFLQNEKIFGWTTKTRHRWRFNHNIMNYLS
jgi:hypothetical protein